LVHASMKASTEARSLGGSKLNPKGQGRSKVAWWVEEMGIGRYLLVDGR
jgi:hypothetical protein